MSGCFFSIIVPVYNVENYLSECIDSILNQEYRNFEIIAVNDGSTDHSGTIIDEYASKDGRIKVVHKPNGGLVSARKAGMECSCGKYILNVDSDDYLEPGALSFIADACLNTDADVVCYGAYRTGQNIKRGMVFRFEEGLYKKSSNISCLLEKVLYDDAAAFYTPGIYPSLCTKAIRRDIYTKCQANAEEKISMGEDLCVSLPALVVADSIYIMNKHLYNYRVNDESITGKYKPHEFEELIRLLDKLKQAVRSDNVNLQCQLDAYITFRFYNICMAEFTYGDSYIKICKKLNKYVGIIKAYMSDQACLYKNKKYKLARFVIKNKLWCYFAFNAARVKKIREKLSES